MGAWGVGAFDNDAASDWLAELDAALSTTLSSTFGPVISIEPDLYLEEPDASEAIAAAEVVAAMRGMAGPSVNGRPTVLAWAVSHCDWATPQLVSEAVFAVERVRASSELRELWAESPDLDEWLAQLEDLLERLRR